MKPWTIETRDTCRFCRMPKAEHAAAAKCLFEPTQYDPTTVLVIDAENGISLDISEPAVRQWVEGIASGIRGV